jgi:hypothetical protein
MGADLAVKSTDPRVIAIRENKLVGRGSCTVVDECYDDADIEKWLADDGINTVDGAIQWAIEAHTLFLQMALDARWGEDDDPQLLEWKRWKEAAKIS